ncbi:MAG: OmpA family protein [Candidatus Cloacimonadaceae bacterium]|jgi:outer membrane protein OmpA-like peptidoglycan-associated protein|nr:OmpA family protein [Candidatus Cloacimonadota bacterium]MDX9949716.1 OmpA family protein [Candidatus Syntrophosphaera sp.]
MLKRSKAILVTLLLLALMPAIHAFESTLLLEGGLGIPLDDIEGTNSKKGAWAVAWDAWAIKDWLGVGISPWFANVAVQGDDPNESYFSSLEGINLYLKVRPTTVGAINFSEDAFLKRISPFAELGAGWSTHGSKANPGIADNPSVPAGFRGHFTVPHAAAGISFLYKKNIVSELGVKYNLFTKDNIDLVETGKMNDALLTPYIGVGINFGAKKTVPVVAGNIDIKAQLARFSTEVGTPSLPQAYDLKGIDLSQGISLEAPEAFEISIDGKNYYPSLELPAGFDGRVLVRLTGAKKGVYEGYISHASKGATPMLLPVFGTVTDKVVQPVLKLDAKLGSFTTVQGTPSAAQAYKISGTNLTGKIQVEAPEGFELSIDGGKTWKKAATVDAGFDGDVLVRLTGAKAGEFGGTLNHDSEGANRVALPVLGVVTLPDAPKLPQIRLQAGDLKTFSTEVGKPSAAQSYKIKGENLKGDIDITAPAGFEFSLDGGKTYAHSMIVPGSIDREILVRLTGAKAGNFSGSIDHASKDATTFKLPVIGTVTDLKVPAIPELNLSLQNLKPFNTELGTPSAPQNYKLNGLNLTGNIQLNAPEGFEISVDGGKTWKPSATVNPNFSGDVWVRLKGDKVGNFAGAIDHKSEGAVTLPMPLVGTVSAPKPAGPSDEDLLAQELAKLIVHFDTNLYVIRDGDKPALDRVAEFLKKLPDTMVEIQGHTDSQGSDKINEPLSHNRAKVVKDYLVARGVDGEQIEIKGYSSKDPIATNSTAAGRQENRRAQMVIIK